MRKNTFSFGKGNKFASDDGIVVKMDTVDYANYQIHCT